MPDWIASHVRTLGFLGGVPSLIVPDNLRSGVSYSCRYDPDANPTYRGFAEHYGTAIMPARVRRPQDKSPVESGVKGVEQRILAKLRNRTFFSLAELNRAISIYSRARIPRQRASNPLKTPGGGRRYRGATKTHVGADNRSGGVVGRISTVSAFHDRMSPHAVFLTGFANFKVF